MAGAAQPGPTCGHTNPVNVNDGTSCRAATPQPGILSRTWSTVSGWGSSAASSVAGAGHSIASWYDSKKASLQRKYDWVKGEARLDYEGGLCIYLAYERANDLALDAILEETGYQLESLLAGLIPGLLQMIVVVGATTVLGATIGGIVGFFFGGAGAAPGAVIGGELGLDAGVAILSWLGLAFLAVEMAKGMGEMLTTLKNGILLAWNARKLSGAAQAKEVNHAGHEFARCVGILMRLILQAILAYILKKAASGATRAAANTELAVRAQGSAVVSEAIIADLVKSIRGSWFGDGLANWVERNWRGLRDNPKLQSRALTPPTGATAPSEPPPEPPKPAEPKPKPKRKPRQPSKTNKNIDQSRTTVNPDGSTTYYDMQGRPVTYNADGYPDFSPYAEAEVQVDNLQGTMPPDDALANQAAGLDSTPDGYTWHHVEDGQTMQLVPSDIHSTFPHTGGASILRSP